MQLSFGLTQGRDLIGHHLSHLVARHRHFAVCKFVFELLLLRFLLSKGLLKFDLLPL